MGDLEFKSLELVNYFKQCIDQTNNQFDILGSGDYLSIALDFGLALMIGILASGVSVRHLNPGVTLSLAVVKKCNWIQFRVYVIAQCLGAFLGAVTLYVNNFNSME